MTAESAAANIDLARTRFSREYAALDAWIQEVPDGATVKGMYFSSLLASLDAGGHERPTAQKFVPFKDYPLTHFMRVMLDSVALAWPTIPPKEGLRSLGQSGYPTLAKSMVGRVIFSVAGRNWQAALPLTEKAYSVSLNPGSAHLAQVGENEALLQMRDVWNFADCYHVGVMEGAMTAYGIEGTVTPRLMPRKCDIDLHLRWT